MEEAVFEDLFQKGLVDIDRDAVAILCGAVERFAQPLADHILDDEHTWRRIFPEHLWDHDSRHVAQMLPEPISIPPFAPKIQLQQDSLTEFLNESHRVIAPTLGDAAG